MGEIKKGKTPIPKQVNIDLLRKVCTVFNESGIDYFLTCGTLLGYIREGDFIEWDSDIDLGVFEIKAFENIIPDLHADGLVVSRYVPGHRVRMSMQYQIDVSDVKSGRSSHVDIFEFEKTSNGTIFRMANNRIIVEKLKRFLLATQSRKNRERVIVQSSIDELIQAYDLPLTLVKSITLIKRWTRRNLFIRQYRHIFDPFVSVDVRWFDIETKIPSNPEDHLRLLYGDNWRIPNPEYSRSWERQVNIRRERL